ncbi:MAG: hypothetical protein RLZZ127_2429 [Planctomycetota bacterium]|jgi:hypothetical protein
MAAGTTSSVSRIALMIALIPVAVIIYYIATLFLPVWFWRNVDFQALAAQTGIPEAKLRTEYQMVIRYHPRGAGDPVPFQILNMTPAWADVDPNHEDETNVAVRVSLKGDRSGEPISDLILGSGGPNGYRDRYFKVTAYRLPGGLFQTPPTRPLVIYKAQSLQKLDVSGAIQWDTQLKSREWGDDDGWEGRADGWMPPQP